LWCDYEIIKQAKFYEPRWFNKQAERLRSILACY
jgi:hypothetical protein